MRTRLVTTLAGLVALIVGIGLHVHYSSIDQQCTSPVGQVGQAFARVETMSGMPDCSTAHLAVQVGWVLIVVGGLFLFGGIAETLKQSNRRLRP